LILSWEYFSWREGKDKEERELEEKKLSLKFQKKSSSDRRLTLGRRDSHGSCPLPGPGLCDSFLYSFLHARP